MSEFLPDYRHILDAVYNKTPKRLPLYEHSINTGFMEKVLDRELGSLLAGDLNDKIEYFRIYCQFHKNYGYDSVSFECCVTELVQGGKGLCGLTTGLVNNKEDIEKFDWAELAAQCKTEFKLYFDALSKSLPPGMKAVGGIGNGIFEIAQDFIPYTEFVYLQFDDPQGYQLLIRNIGLLLMDVWTWLLENYQETFAICRFGDDLGFKTSTLLNPVAIINDIIPQYQKVIDLIHSYNKPFLLHCCGYIFDLMDNLIDQAKIDAKHSNEDQIAPFNVWLEKYGHKIGNFGGIETNILCLSSEAETKAYVTDVCKYSQGYGGVAIGSGNQISDYIEVANFIAMTEAVREYRGE
jgi:uroporphyrinogen decarboxylase